MLIYILWFGSISYLAGWSVAFALKDHSISRFQLPKMARKVFFLNMKGKFTLSVTIYQALTVISIIWAISMIILNQFITGIDLIRVEELWRSSRLPLFVLLLPNIIRINIMDVRKDRTERRIRRGKKQK